MRILKNKNRVAVVTGATGAIGQALVAGLAQRNYKVILLIRDEQKGIETISNIRNANSKANLEYRIVDLSVQSEIKSIAKSWNESLDLLINNAAITPLAREETQQGIELQFATNVLGYYWMVKHFTEILQESAPSRVVNVASYWAGGLDLSDLEFKTRSYHNHDAYRQSKQANRMLTPIQADQFDPAKVTINACHPGDVNSKLSNNLGFGGSQSPSEGANTPLWLATSEDLFGTTGKYFESRKEVHCPFGSNRIESEKLDAHCQSYRI
jgi:NAD(P)-dependent dehydrogenase (short-subunit alcohol dehydrogenase family)